MAAMSSGRWKVRCAVAAAAIVVVSQPAGAADKDFSGSYYCTEEFGGGIGYNESLKQWQGQAFIPQAKFIVGLKLPSSTPNSGNAENLVQTYSMTTTDSGTTNTSACTYSGNYGDESPVRLETDFPLLGCWSNFFSYRIDLATLRYLRVYFAGYVNGADNNDNTPSVMGGTCTKIN
ncbi:MAG: hypothetical protein ABI697_06810 [Devosia sp.]